MRRVVFDVLAHSLSLSLPLSLSYKATHLKCLIPVPFPTPISLPPVTPSLPPVAADACRNGNRPVHSIIPVKGVGADLTPVRPHCSRY